jgi:hypothetical protein
LSGHKIILQFANGDLLTFAIPLKKQAVEWVEAFRQSVKIAKSHFQNVPLMSNTINTFAERRGLLFYLASSSNWISRSEIWTCRNVCLESDGTLVLRELSRLGHFPLTPTTQIEPYDDTCFHLTRKVTGDGGNTLHEDRILTLRCDSLMTCERWKSSIAQICQEHVLGNHVSTAEADVVEFYNTLHDVMETGKSLKIQRPSPPPLNNNPSGVHCRRPFFILSIDGGGTRGIIPCILLERILKEFPDFLSRVNMVAGTR